jgi:protein-tyrosine phosphatase
VHCHEAQLLLVMTRSQKAETEQRFPLTRGKVYLLGHYGRFEVADPYRKPLSAFEAAYVDIERGVQAWCQVLRRL